MIEIVRTLDEEVAREILLECWEEFAEDGVKKCPSLNMEGEIWLLVLDGGVPAGIYRVAQITSVLFDAHVCIRKPFRSKSFQYASLFYCWLLENLVYLRKLVASIPEFNRPAVIYAIAIGMTRHGYISDSYMKHGELCGMVQLGITRKQMEKITCPQQSEL